MVHTAAYSPNPIINDTILWLLELGLPPIPIAPWHSWELGNYFNASYQPGNRQHGRTSPPKDKFTGKNPSYLSCRGNPILLDVEPYRTQMPDTRELRRWFQDGRTGIAALGGVHNVVWVDIDAKCFRSVADCEAVTMAWVARHHLKRTYIERTPRGGYHVSLQVPHASALQFSRFQWQDAPGRHAGEVITHNTIVLAPTQGSQGQYQCLYRNLPLKVQSLEEVGVVALCSGHTVERSQNSSKPQWFRTQSEGLKALPAQAYTRSPLLRNLLSKEVRDLLLHCHSVEEGTRSDVLVRIAREALGWQNWLMGQGFPPPIPDAERFIFQIGEEIGLDEGRIQRILESDSGGEPIADSLPGIHYYGGDAACLKRLKYR